MPAQGPNNDVAVWGRAARLISNIQRYIEQSFATSRYGAYGEQVADILTAKQNKLADEGSYFITRTPTVGTGIACVTSLTTYTAASPILIVTNNNPPAGKNVWLDYINLNVTAVPTSATSLYLVTALDATPRYSSAGSGGAGTNLATGLNGPYPTNTGAPLGSGALIYAGALVATAASPAVRLLTNRIVRSQIPVALDQYQINFGTTDSPTIGNSGVAQATGGLQVTVPHPPVCVAPGGSFLLYYYGAASAAAPSFEFEIGHVER